MPRTTKAKSENEEKVAKVKTPKNKTNTVKTTKSKPTTVKKTTKKTSPTKKPTTKKETTKKGSISKKTSTTKKATIKTPKINIIKKVKTANPEGFSVAEYYDLPDIYDKTVVKLLAQTPSTLFVYWNISADDRNKYIEQYGEKFFETTKPVLIIHNDTMNYSFEVDINDFANCWYLNINDSRCKYRVELGRRPIQNNIIYNPLKINTNYIYIDSSNQIESPNDHILFDTNQKTIYFKNVKTNSISSKNINFSYMKQIGKIYNIYDMYKKIYSDELIQEFDLTNPSSGNPSSTFK